MNTRAIIEQYKKNNLADQIRNTKQVRLMGESMLPVLDPKDISVLFVSEPSYQIGDVVVFESKKSLVGVSVHRIVKIKGDRVITKGDNNLQCDPEIHKAAIIGKVEKALQRNGTFLSVRSSKLFSFLSNAENSLAAVLPQKMMRSLHRRLIKVYRRHAFH